MTIEIISGEDAWSKERLANPYRSWPTRKNSPYRLYPIPTPTTQATFKIQPDDKIYCIGSCFARELSEALHRLNYNVLSVFRDLPPSPLRKRPDADMFNKYTVASIYNELSWTLNPDTPYQHDNVLIETANHLFQDHQLAGHHYADTLEAAQIFREAMNAAFAKIKEADVVVLTLGLSEVWFDKQTQLYLNVRATAELTALYPNRFEVHIFDYEETLFYLNAIYTLLKNHLKPSFRLLITASPVPLGATFRQQDVLLANMYSKSVLRVGVEKFVSDKDNVNYFPSYEFVSLSNPELVWHEEDFRHVNHTFVDYIMGNVMAQFTDTLPSIDEKNQFLKATSLYYGGFLKEAKTLLTPLLKSSVLPKSEVLLLWSAIQLNLEGQSKSWLLRMITHFKTNRHLKLTDYIKKLADDYRRLSQLSFAGYLESWDGEYLTGWACNLKRDTPIQLKIVSGQQVIEVFLANNPRADVANVYGKKHLLCGFRIPLAQTQIEQTLVRVVFADTDYDLQGSPLSL